MLACKLRSSESGSCTVGKDYMCISGIGLTCSVGFCRCKITVI